MIFNVVCWCVGRTRYVSNTDVFIVNQVCHSEQDCSSVMPFSQSDYCWKFCLCSNASPPINPLPSCSNYSILNRKMHWRDQIIAYLHRITFSMWRLIFLILISLGSRHQDNTLVEKNANVWSWWSLWLIAMMISLLQCYVYIFFFYYFNFIKLFSVFC